MAEADAGLLRLFVEVAAEAVRDAERDLAGRLGGGEVLLGVEVVERVADEALKFAKPWRFA